LKIVNARFQCNLPVAMDQRPEMQPIESLRLNESEIKFQPILHRNIHRRSKGEGNNDKERAQESDKHLDAGR
jgi:hypothetical protein